MTGGSGGWERHAALVDFEGNVEFKPNMIFEHKDHCMTQSTNLVFVISGAVGFGLNKRN